LRDDLPAIIESQALNNLAVIERSANPLRAEALLHRDLELHAKIDDQYGRCATLINLALIAIDQHHRDEARVLLKSAVQAADRANADDLLARITGMLQEVDQ
jgi:hypothetical protein